MDIAVLVKQSLDVQELRVDQDTGKIYIEDAPTKAGDIELNATEEAVRLKEKLGGKAIAIMLSTWGSSGKRQKEAREALTRVLAMGLDGAVLIMGEGAEEGDTYVIAKVLAEEIREKFRLVLAAEGSEDNFSGLLPARLAAELGWPDVAYATAIEVEGDYVKVTRSLEDFEEVVKVKLPAVISVTQEINKPRVPKLVEIVKAKKKPMDQKDFSPHVEPKLVIRELKVPKVERKQIVIEGDVEEAAEKLIQALKEEGVL
ncbi:MAG: electron transfer flavoprotein subunit beta/FixA family protein [Candidatus Korarchaeota archaeon]|nr:electron transfer flavoprotein subunit beta/FixA family protein [Candidatus Korarchaeota archaeon]